MTLKKSHDEAEEKQLLQATKLILCDLGNPAIVISKRGLIKVGFSLFVYSYFLAHFVIPCLFTYWLIV
jgi:hypothetical protein